MILGYLWNAVAMYLMGGGMNEIMRSSFTGAGVIAGIAGAGFTVWSRRKTLGFECLRYVLANYYVGILAYWVSFIVIERVWLCINTGGWTDFDLYDNVILIFWLLFGSVWYGIFLIPLCYGSRFLVWELYRRSV
jgi:hypothetical protein